jgi:hypothetical protein
MVVRPIPDPREALLTCLLAAAAGGICAGLVVAAALVPAPPAALPLLISVCVACPLLAAWELPMALSVLRLGRTALDPRTGGPLELSALRELRRRLDELPETEHPLGY